jgi:hypothetical protein
MDEKPIERQHDVASSLAYLRELFLQRNALYKDAGFKTFGEQAFLFLGPIELKTAEDFGRLALLFQVIAKTARYSANFATGGHSDSLDDAAVYAMMLQQIDHK